MAPEETHRPSDPPLHIGLVGGSGEAWDLPPGARRFSSLPSAADCDLVIVDQKWPDEFTLRDVESLLGGAARVICCYGPWCESDGRTRTSWPQAVRTPRSAWRDALLHETEVLAGHRPALPVTASRDELFLASRPDDVRLTCAVTVDSPDRTLRDAIRARLAAAGCQFGEESRLRAIVDADPWNAVTRDRLVRWTQTPSVERVIALTGFRRDAEVAEMESAGADMVVDKLDLERQLLRALAEFQDR